jgi:hypothetical protein
MPTVRLEDAEVNLKAMLDQELSFEASGHSPPILIYTCTEDGGENTLEFDEVTKPRAANENDPPATTIHTF